MSKQPVSPNVPSPPDMYTQLRGKIVDGSISLEEIKQLYEKFDEIKKSDVKAEAIEAMNKDLHIDIASDKFHSFASKLVEVEKQIVIEQYPIKDTDSPEKKNSVQTKRCAEYMRNTSLAKNVMVYECTKNKFAKNISDSLIKGNPKEAKQRLSDLKIPDFLKEHYSSITKFYKENGNEVGAMTNLTFHSVLTSVSRYSKSSIKDDPKGIKQAELLMSANTAIKSVYSSPESYNKLKAQIPEYKETVSAKPTFKVKAANTVNSFVDKAKEFVGVKEKSAAPVTQNIQNPVTPARPKSNAPEKVVRTTIDVVPISRHRSNAVPLTSGMIEQAKALHPVTNTTPSSKPIIGKHRDPQPPGR